MPPDLLKEAATNYRDRKANQGHTGLGNSLDDRRMKFADDVIATCAQCKADLNQIVRDIDSELLHGYPPKKEPFLEIEDYDLFFRPYTRKTTVWEDALQQNGAFLDAWQNPDDPALMEAACDNAQKIIEDAIAAE